jgi:phosphoglycolate phosphatase-like HAD superfamily hydrolase
MIEAVNWDYDGTLVDTRQKNLDVTKEIVWEVLQKNHETFSALQSLENYEKANSRSANWRDLYTYEFSMKATVQLSILTIMKRTLIVPIMPTSILVKRR